MENEEKDILIVRIRFNDLYNKPEYSWDFPNNIDTTRMLGVLELIRDDLLNHWYEQNNERGEEDAAD